MNNNQASLDALQDIKSMMERSSRFISLSGWSGIGAGICALIGGGLAYRVIKEGGYTGAAQYQDADAPGSFSYLLSSDLFIIAVLTLVAALLSAFIFTYRNSRKRKVTLWNATSKRLVESMIVPLTAGGLFALYLAVHALYGLIAPSLLLFYGLAVVNASKYTLSETKWLGYSQVALGLINLLFIGYGLYFWITGFGILHILYGIVMWRKYERSL